MRNIELKRIKYFEGMSKETLCYTADLWVDGKLFCHVENEGHGGCDMQRPATGFTHHDIDALNAEIKATYPKQSVGKGDDRFEYETDIECVCNDLMVKWLEAKDEKRIDAKIKRELDKTVVYFDPERNGIFSIKAKFVEQYGKVKVIEEVQKKHPNVRVLNDMPLDKAIALYREKAA